jgi:hypothetical protein
MEKCLERKTSERTLMISRFVFGVGFIYVALVLLGTNPAFAESEQQHIVIHTGSAVL